MTPHVEIESLQPGIDVFRYKEQVIGMCIRKKADWSSTRFLTDDAAFLQIGLLHYDQTTPVKAHAHYRVPRNVDFTCEVLFCVYGRIRYIFYDEADNWRELVSCEITDGDVLCLMGAGHGGTALERTRLVEVKQGPFLGTSDKFFKAQELQAGQTTHPTLRKDTTE